MFHKSPDILWNAVFNVFQSAVMTIAVSVFLGQATPENLLKTFAYAYFAGVALTLFLNSAGFGNWIAKRLHCSGVAAYLVSSFSGGAFMGVFMNFFMTFMAMGPVHGFFSAYLYSLPFAMLVSALSSCCWIKLTELIVKKVYG